MKMYIIGNGETGSEIASKMLGVLMLALEINPPEIKDIGKKKTAVFVEWMPHTSSLNVRIFKNGWIVNDECDEKYTVYADWEGASEELDMIISRLYEIKKIDHKR